MQPPLFRASVSTRLLVVAVERKRRGEPPTDAATLADAIGLTLGAAKLDDAVCSLAQQGLVEALYTPAGWQSIKPTTQGLARVGRQRMPSIDEPIPATPGDGGASVAQPSAAERLSDWYAARESAFRGWLTPRVSAMRTSLSHAVHLFTSFP